MWYRTKDVKKFGKGKIPKNRNCKKFGYSSDREYRKKQRKIINFLKNCLIHHIPFNESEFWWGYVQDAKEQYKLWKRLNSEAKENL